MVKEQIHMHLVGPRSQSQRILVQRSLLLLVAWALVWSWFAPQLYQSRILVCYLLPDSRTLSTAPLSSQQRALLLSWSNPVSWALLQLQNPILPEALCKIIEAESGPRLGLRREMALQLLRRQQLHTRTIGNQLLEISVRADNQSDADHLARGLVQYLNQQSKEESLKHAFQAEANADLVSQEEALQNQENLLRTRLMVSQSLTQNIALLYTSRHYQEAWNQVQHLRSQNQLWQDLVAHHAPRLVVLAGPDAAADTNRWGLRLGLLLAFLIFSLRNYRGKR